VESASTMPLEVLFILTPASVVAAVLALVYAVRQ
jgi:hypothetical protein